MEQAICVDIIYTSAALLTFNVNSQFDGNLMGHKNLNTKNACLVRCMLNFEFFNKPYDVLEFNHCIECLSPGRQESPI
jgi:hypothetical protein